METTSYLQPRAKEALAGYLETFPWHGCFTATFARPSRYAAGTLDLLRPILKSEAKRALLVAEQHVSGMWHAHGLVYYHHQPGFEHEGDCAHTAGRLAHFGWASCTEIKNVTHTVSYCSKYLLKDNRMEWELEGRAKTWVPGSESVNIDRY